MQSEIMGSFRDRKSSDTILFGRERGGVVIEVRISM